MTHDGLYRYEYDAWNRLASVTRTYPDANGALQTGSTIATMKYDGLNRRTRKMVANSGDLDCTYQYLYDRQWRLLETRNKQRFLTPMAPDPYGPRLRPSSSLNLPASPRNVLLFVSHVALAM